MASRMTALGAQSGVDGNLNVIYYFQLVDIGGVRRLVDEVTPFPTIVYCIVRTIGIRSCSLSEVSHAPISPPDFPCLPPRHPGIYIKYINDEKRAHCEHCIIYVDITMAVCLDLTSTIII